MAVKFEFTVNDVDAENIMGAMNDYIVKMQLKILDEMEGSNREQYILSYKRHQEYFRELIGKMKNTRQ